MAKGKVPPSFLKHQFKKGEDKKVEAHKKEAHKVSTPSESIKVLHKMNKHSHHTALTADGKGVRDASKHVPKMDKC